MPTLFGIEISRAHNIKGCVRLLFSEVIHYKQGNIVDFDGIDQDFDSCDEIRVVPYDDYLIDGEKPHPVVFKNFDNVSDYFYSNICFNDIKYECSACNVVLGFKVENKNINTSSKHMKKLLNLRDRLYKENRINGKFFFGNDCCS